MKNLYICSTPAQLINMVNLLQENHDNDENHLYYLNHSKESNEIFNKIQEFNFFQNLFYLETIDFNHHWTQKNKLIRYVTKTLEYLSYKSISKKFLNNKNIYDNFYTAFMDRSSFLMFMDYKSVNINMKLHFIGDGVGGYNLLTTKQNKIDRFILKLLGFKSVFEEMTSLYVYNKELVSNLYYKHVELKELPKITDIKVKKFINKVFDYKLDNIEILNHKYIYFEAPYTINNISKNQFVTIQYLIEKLDLSLIVKQHPRTIQLPQIPNKFVSKDRYPMEVLASNYNLSDYVLISGLSAAAIMPKLMFNHEPYVIFLYRIFQQDPYTLSGSHYLEFLENFKSLYKNKEKVFIPNNINELNSILEDLEKQRCH